MSDSEAAKGTTTVQIPQASGRHVYSNLAQVSFSPLEFRLTFGCVIAEVFGSEEATLTGVTLVFLSPTHAKLLSGILQRQLAEYEAKVGPIPVPPNADVAGTGTGTAPPPEP